MMEDPALSFWVECKKRNPLKFNEEFQGVSAIG